MYQEILFSNMKILKKKTLEIFCVKIDFKNSHLKFFAFFRRNGLESKVLINYINYYYFVNYMKLNLYKLILKYLLEMKEIKILFLSIRKCIKTCKFLYGLNELYIPLSNFKMKTSVIKLSGYIGYIRLYR